VAFAGLSRHWSSAIAPSSRRGYSGAPRNAASSTHAGLPSPTDAANRELLATDATESHPAYGVEIVDDVRRALSSRLHRPPWRRSDHRRPADPLRPASPRGSPTSRSPGSEGKGPAPCPYALLGNSATTPSSSRSNSASLPTPSSSAVATTSSTSPTRKRPATPAEAVELRAAGIRLLHVILRRFVDDDRLTASKATDGHSSPGPQCSSDRHQSAPDNLLGRPGLRARPTVFATSDARGRTSVPGGSWRRKRVHPRPRSSPPLPQLGAAKSPSTRPYRGRHRPRVQEWSVAAPRGSTSNNMRAGRGG